MLRQLNIFIISILSFALGINYCLLAWLDYSIIGLNGEFMSTARVAWGIIQTILGFLLTVFLFYREKAMYLHKYWTIIASIVFVMQLPMASLWYMMLMREPIVALSGVAIHTILIALITIDYLTSHKSSYKSKKEYLENVEDPQIKLDT